MQSIFDLYKADRHNDVVSLYQSSDIRPQVDPDQIFIVAASYFHLGEYRESYQFLKSIQSSFSDDISFLSLYAASCRHVGQLAESKKFFLRALSISPDDISLLNNYSNLLVDLQDTEQACSILHDLVEKNPNYSDAISNYNRVKQIIKLRSTPLSSDLISGSTHEKESMSSKHKSLSMSKPASTYVDPLLFAFTEDEVKRTAPFRPSFKTEHDSGSLAELKDSFPTQDVNALSADQLSLAIRAVKEGNSSFALQVCSHALQGLRNNSELYACVADAYLSQKNFVNAELYFLHSLALGGNTFKNNFNLASLACMKRDFGLAEYYLSVASSLDKSSKLIEKLQSQIISLREKVDPKNSFDFSNLSPYGSNVQTA